MHGLLRVTTASAVLVLALFVAFHPVLVFAPAPKVILYLLVSLLPAVLFASEAAAKFELKLPGFAACAGGGAALVFTSLVLLTRLEKPEQQIAVFEVENDDGSPVQGLERPGALEFRRSDSGLSVTPLISGSTLVVIFPEQMPQVDVRLRLGDARDLYVATLSYAGTRTRELHIGKEFRPLNPQIKGQQ